MANHDMEPDSEPDYDATNDDGQELSLRFAQGLTYGSQAEQLAAAIKVDEEADARVEWMADGTPYWQQWLSGSSDALEAGWGPSSSGSPPPAPPPTSTIATYVVVRKRWARDLSCKPPTMICHQCKQQHALGALIDHIKGAHECNASTRLIVDNVKSFQDACCFVPIYG